MDKARLENALENEQSLENATQEENGVRTLKDLEMVLVGGGGDDGVCW